MDFACKTIKAQQVLKCSLGLSKAGCAIMHYLRKNDSWHTSEDVAKKTKYDLATTQRTLKQLYEREILERRQHNRPSGGFEYHYRIVDEATIRKIVFAVLDDWLLRAKREIDSFLLEKKK